MLNFFSKENNMRYLPALMLSLLAVGCNHSNDFMTRYHDDGRAKPAVAITSMIDTTSFELPWSLSEEFTSTLVQQVGVGGKLYVIATEDDVFTENPFGQDLSWIKREYADHEFVAFLELVEHEIAPASKFKKDPVSQQFSTNLNMAVRLRIVDVRGQLPTIVLQEMIRDSYFIPKTLMPTDYSSAVWGTPEFQKSPMGIAHKQIVQEIASRIKEYILLAKSR